MALITALQQFTTGHTLEELTKAITDKRLINSQDPKGQTPLHHLLIHGADEEAKRLMLAGGELDIADREGITPSHLLHMLTFQRKTRPKLQLLFKKREWAEHKEVDISVVESAAHFQYQPGILVETYSDLLTLRNRKKATLPRPEVRLSITYVSETIGYGLFATEDIPLGTAICEYGGIVRKNDRRDSLNDYLYKYPSLDEIGRNYVIDAKEIGDLGRFANHSEKPNCRIETYSDGLFDHQLLIANKPIYLGDEIRYNYGQAYWYLRGLPEA